MLSPFSPAHSSPTIVILARMIEQNSPDQLATAKDTLKNIEACIQETC